MPNIEIHGFVVPSMEDVEKVKAFVADLKNLKEQIKKLLIDTSSADGAIITTIPDESEDLHGNPQPFLRIVAPKSEIETIADIEDRLKPLNMDVEVLLLERFTVKS